MPIRRSLTLATRLGIVACAALMGGASASGQSIEELERTFANPPVEAKPWVFWYWMKGRVSPEGITADLEAMSYAGLGGAYLMPIQGPDDPPMFEPPATQLSPRFWEMIRHTAREADRLGLQLGMHLCDGFATAGGPWITPELSMQQIVWSRARVKGGDPMDVTLPEPDSREGFYRDIAALALPCPLGFGVSTESIMPRVTTSDDEADAARLTTSDNEVRYRCEKSCWIRYDFEVPFTGRSVTITSDGSNYQCQRLTVEASDDGQTWRQVAQLDAPRHGWQEEGKPVTHALPETTARAFRFTWDPAGSEPGAEDLDTAKWAPVLKVKSIVLSSEARLHHYRGKAGEAWRISPTTSDEQCPQRLCKPLANVIDVSRFVDSEGRLHWDAPPGDWLVMRFGHTSTGRRNSTAGGGIGLECDKLSGRAMRLQYDRWFGEARRQIADELGDDKANQVLGTLHLDSWECGAQNWTADFAQEFRERLGRDLIKWLPAMAGMPIESAAASERFLHDVRETIADLLAERFYGTLSQIADEEHLRFTGECTAPTMLGDGMRHFASLDVPMGEFWLESPTHDKPTDLRDAISAGHVYGKRVIQAEAFTQLRMRWDETPGALKPLGDRVLASGVNRLALHVWAHNPWLDRQPGQTLGDIGLYFQRDQPWIRGARGWMDYLARCQAVLQAGRPVVDLALWTGDEIPRRALVPEKLVDVVPGLMGEDAKREVERRQNKGLPQRELPRGVRASANIPDPDSWLDPLHGYAYDSINSDAILRLASVEDGRITLPGGASYAMLIMPSKPRDAELRERIAALQSAGGRVLSREEALRLTPEKLDVSPDLLALNDLGQRVDGITWSHRAGDDWDVYFVSNQSDNQQRPRLSLRGGSRAVELWDPVTGVRWSAAPEGSSSQGTLVPVTLASGQSMFVVLRDANIAPTPGDVSLQTAIAGPWRVSFKSAVGNTPPSRTLDELSNLSEQSDLRDFVGEAHYETVLESHGPIAGARRVWLDVGPAAALAEVRVNGVVCGVAWAPPWRIDIARALKQGENRLEITTPSVWRNRLVAEQGLPQEESAAWTTATAPLGDTAPVPFGLMGPVQLLIEKP